MEALPRGVLRRRTTLLASLPLILCVTTACGDVTSGGGIPRNNPLAPTPTLAPGAGFSARSVHLPRIINRAGRSTSPFRSSGGGVTKKALDEVQATELAAISVGTLADAAVEALNDCQIGADGQLLCSINTADSCDLGGRVEVHGAWSGSIDSAGVGVLLLDSSETLTDCQLGNGIVVNGDPALTLTATVNTDGSGTFQFGGGIKWVEQDGTAGACQVSVTSIIDAAGNETDSGTICGTDVIDLY
jgi:hypothetical protein